MSLPVSAPVSTVPEPKRSAAPEAVGGPYASYVLGVLVVVYVLNFLDRNILSILNERIRADLGISDAAMGFLYGTAFAVFYAIFGIPLGRLADVWSRRSLIALGLAFWSLMTALSGFSRNLVELGAARIGVGVGEASATPAAYSMLTDSFPARLRATVLAIYSGGIYIGAGLGIFIGGQIVDRWDRAFSSGGAPLGLAGWQAAFLAVGIPGLLLALWVRTLREPVRGASDGIYTEPEPHPFREFVRELSAVVPPFTLLHLARSGVGARGLLANLGWAVGIAGVAFLLVRLTGSVAQWSALAVGVYAAVSWARSLALRDRVASTLIFDASSLRWASLGFAFLAFGGYGLGYWTVPWFVRVHGAGEAQVGTVLGLTAAVSGFVGITLGGIFADRWRARSRIGRVNLGLILALAPIPLGLWMLSTQSRTLAYFLNVPVCMFSAAYIGIGASTVQDLVLPRMRAIASAFYLLMITFIGLALGPYTIGFLSDQLGDLTQAMRIGLLGNVVAFGFLLLLRRTLPRDEESLVARARAAGEPMGDPL